jgi:hypothetical protein
LFKSRSTESGSCKGGYTLEGEKLAIMLYTSDYKNDAEAMSPILEASNIQVAGKCIDDSPLPEILYSCKYELTILCTVHCSEFFTWN